jgi:hypothetical protein
MIGRSLPRRLERLEEHIIPEDERKVWEIIIVDSDGTRTPTGIRIEMPPSAMRVHVHVAMARSNGLPMMDDEPRLLAPAIPAKR